MKLAKIYEPQEYETTIYELWEQSRAFEPKHRGNDGSYSIVVPPPNANGNLHLGHGLTLAIEDIAVRYHRMKGEASLLLPGADHAGFETWVVYEKQLAAQGKTRFDFSREELYQQIWDFVALNKDNYQTQFRRLGASVDWSRYVYTLDQKIVDRAYKTFEKMFSEGLVYRAEKLVNFCTFHGTGFADIEVAFKDEPGHLWHISYPLTDGSGEITVATTRPETMLGDTAVAVHPEDARYKHLAGKTVKLPLTNREIPIIFDDFVEMEFGTGAVKITPAHDNNDYEAGKRHDLPMITVITHEGTLSHDAPEAYAGMTVAEARKAVVANLEKDKFLVKTEDITHNVGHCYKCDTVIEPLLREQWFISVKELAKPAIAALKADKITFHPASKKKQLIDYLEALRDWNISRQIAWGIPIPAFQNIDEPDDWIFDTNVAEEFIKKGDKTYRRDPDVFDTWFSSSSWPYATLDFPDGEDFKEFYPLSLMETGADILYPWVSRMLMFGLYVAGDIPFKEVYLHGLIQDEHGQKMSKSKGNVINPMDKLDEYGSDAFRMGIISGETAGSNRPYDPSKLVGARNFCNKLWNVARFVEGIVGDEFDKRLKPVAESAADHWILLKLQQASDAIAADLEKYRFSEAYDKLYHVLWDDFADWYIEANKTSPNHAVLAHGLETLLKLAHPFAPFLSETIWQTLKWEGDSLLATSSWPKLKAGDQQEAAVFSSIQAIVGEARGMIRNLSLVRPHLYYSDSALLKKHGKLVARLARLDGVSEVRDGNGLNLTQTNENCWLDVGQEVARNYLGKLEERQNAEVLQVERLNARLATKSYVDNAPKKLVDETKAQLTESTDRLAQITAEIDSFAASSKEL